MEAHALVDDHFAVEVIEGADPEVAVLQQLGNGDGSVVDAIEERRHGGRLVQGARSCSVVMDAVITLPVGQHGRRPAPEPLVRGARASVNASCPVASNVPESSEVERTGRHAWRRTGRAGYPAAMTDVEVFIDPSCPWAWVTSRWVVDVAPQRDLTITWRSYCLEIRDDYGVAPTVPRPTGSRRSTASRLAPDVADLRGGARRGRGGAGGSALHRVGGAGLRRARPEPERLLADCVAAAELPPD